jgi:hypothetical protein
MNQFEQLIEYVINDEEQKARALFHDIVVGKSRQIYEDLMSQEEEDIEEGMMGGDAADDLIDDVEAEEQDDMSMEAHGDNDETLDVEVDSEMDDMGTDDMGTDDHATKDDILNLEDKLDQLMAEFEDLMGSDADMGNGDDFGSEEGGDAIEMDDTDEMGMMEAVNLKAAPKPVTSEEGSINKKSTVAANAGAKGPVGNTVRPVHTGANEGGHHDSGAYKNATKELIGRVGNTPAQGTQKPSAATKPQLGQSSGVNTKSPLARG